MCRAGAIGKAQAPSQIAANRGAWHNFLWHDNSLQRRDAEGPPTIKARNFREMSDMARNAAGNNLGTAGNDFLWGKALVLGNGEYDNYLDMDSATTFNALRGYGGNDTIFGDIYYDGDDGTEGDQIFGGDGDDVLFGDCGTDEPGWATSENGASDVIYGDAGNDRIYGQAGGDNLYGGTGHDTIIGGIGSDNIVGGDGNDVIYVDLVGALTAIAERNLALGGSGNDRIVGGWGNDELYGMDDRDQLLGGQGDDKIEGGNGADYLTGGEGNDYMRGGGYYATTADLSDTLLGEAGNDYLSGERGSDQISGGTGRDTLDGGTGNDLLDGGTGADDFVCGAGNDVYVIDNSGDKLLWDYSDSGTDLIESAINWTLGAYQENLTLTGQASTGNGNAGANWVIGNASNNILRGMGGNDSLLGAAGTDVMFGNDGNDKLNGGAGKDYLAGGAGTDWLIGDLGADRFIFTGISESRAATGMRDFIDDFSYAQGDRIDLGQIDANTALAGNQAFSFIGLADFSGRAGQLCYDRIGTDVRVSADVNGDKVADFQINMDEVSSLTAGAFLL